MQYLQKVFAGPFAVCSFICQVYHGQDNEMTFLLAFWAKLLPANVFHDLAEKLSKLEWSSFQESAIRSFQEKEWTLEIQ